MIERSVADLFCDRFCETVFHLVLDEIQEWPSRFEVNGSRPVLLFSRDSGVYPFFMDLGDERLSVEIEVTIRRIVKGGPEDGSCAEEEALA